MKFLQDAYGVWHNAANIASVFVSWRGNERSLIQADLINDLDRTVTIEIVEGEGASRRAGEILMGKGGIMEFIFSPDTCLVSMQCRYSNTLLGKENTPMRENEGEAEEYREVDLPTSA